MPIRRHRAGWQVRIQVGGRRIERTVGGTKAHAKAFEARLRREVVEGRVGLSTEHTIEEALARWLKGEARALKSYESLLDKVAQIRPFVVGKSLNEIADAAQAVREDGLGRGLRPATINRRLAILRRVARLAANEWAWTDRNLGARVKLLPGERARTVSLSAEQVSELLRACPDAQTRAAVLLASLTGLREGELLRLGPQHYRSGKIVLDADTKTGRPRVIPLRRELESIARNLPIGLSYPQLRKRFESARQVAAMPWLQFRDLRRTFGSWVVQQTGSLKAAQDLLGHTTPTITAKHYAHLLDTHLSAAIAALPTLKTEKKWVQNGSTYSKSGLSKARKLTNPLIISARSRNRTGTTG